MTIFVSGDGRLVFQDKVYQCAIGKNAIRCDKREGDNATPVGRFPLRRVLYRADRIFAPETKLDIKQIWTDDGWCDDPDHLCYNQPVKLPFDGSCEQLCREDNIYDIIVVLGHNDDPPVPGLGSAIFFHLARDNYEGTEGCVAVKLDDMLEILKAVEPDEEMEITL